MAVDSRAKTYRHRQNWGVGQIAVQDRCSNPVGKLEVKPLDEKPTSQAVAERFKNATESWEIYPCQQPDNVLHYIGVYRHLGPFAAE